MSSHLFKPWLELITSENAQIQYKLDLVVLTKVKLDKL